MKQRTEFLSGASAFLLFWAFVNGSVILKLLDKGHLMAPSADIAGCIYSGWNIMFSPIVLLAGFLLIKAFPCHDNHWHLMARCIAWFHVIMGLSITVYETMESYVYCDNILSSNVLGLSPLSVYQPALEYFKYYHVIVIGVMAAYWSLYLLCSLIKSIWIITKHKEIS